MGHKCTLFPLYRRVSAFFDDILHKDSEAVDGVSQCSADHFDFIHVIHVS
uniref:Uncharacterized protein n=1 Tax=Anguilla anguilla TaxID=7936 RepID=A0A0E9Y294_ANGAN